ncbi:PqiC family protein [Methylosarcina fibrata]|uniref:PqiC family protein n=1 Tax=Methylosarcina fibrata TaxID=105972 RepID=UPI00036D398C|nr:PqiC family protein [Methylosarcina fibrata]
MKAHSLIRRWLPYALGLAVAACASTPPTRFYILEPLTASGTASVNQEPERIIGVGPVTLAALLERKQLVIRDPEGSIEISEQHQWAAPLRDNILQTLTENLGILLSRDLIKAYPWSAYGRVDYRLLVDIVRFDATPGRAANLEANWAVMKETDHRILKHGLVNLSRPLSDRSPAASVKALSELMNDFSRQMAGVLESVR